MTPTEINKPPFLMQDSVLTTVILPASLAIIMLGMGLSLTIDDFRRVLKYPKAALIGAFNQLLFLPLIAFLLIKIVGLTGGLAIGVMILAACPGGTTSNIITHVSRGDTALSVSLTAISTLVTFFSIPFIANFAIDHFETDVSQFELPVMKTIGALFVITILPVSIGMLIKRYRDDMALKLDRPVRIASVVLFILIVVGIIIAKRADFMTYMKSAGIISLLLCVSTMVFGFFTAKLGSLSKKQAITISIESGIQNGALALLITEKLIVNTHPSLSIAPATYGLLMFIPGAFMMYYFGRRKGEA